jgi:hypothetical protein
MPAGADRARQSWSGSDARSWRLAGPSPYFSLLEHAGERPPYEKPEKFMHHPLFPLLLQVCLADAEGSSAATTKGKDQR